MPNYDERIEKQLEKIEKLKQQNKDRQARNLKQRQKLEDRRKFVIGETIIKYFPETLPLSTKQTTDEKKKLIASFDDFIAALSADQGLVSAVKNRNNL